MRSNDWIRALVGGAALIALFFAVDATAHEEADIVQIIVEKAPKYGIRPHVAYAIFKHESGLRVDAVNHRTKDYGIAQINIYNIRARGWDYKRMTSDPEYAVERGLIVLSEFKRRYKHREPNTWYCRYNIGNRNLKEERWKRICERYLKRSGLIYFQSY